MKICYVDESGNEANDPCLIMVGIIVDAARLSRTRDEFAEEFESIQSLFQESMRELKGSKMIFGRDRWRKVDHVTRKRIADHLCQWIVNRKHKLVLSAIDRAEFNKGSGTFTEISADPWLAGSLHIALQLQRIHQTEGNNKGQTFLILDDNKQQISAFAEIIYNPPPWTDDYYKRGKKQERLDQIIDSAFAVKSHHAGLVQVADLYAFIIRRYVEISQYGKPEEWSGEMALITHYFGILKPRLTPAASRWPSRPGDDCSRYFNRLAPPSLLAL